MYNNIKQSDDIWYLQKRALNFGLAILDDITLLIGIVIVSFDAKEFFSLCCNTIHLHNWYVINHYLQIRTTSWLCLGYYDQFLGSISAAVAWRYPERNQRARRKRDVSGNNHIDNLCPCLTIDIPLSQLVVFSSSQGKVYHCFYSSIWNYISENISINLVSIELIFSCLLS